MELSRRRRAYVLGVLAVVGDDGHIDHGRSKAGVDKFGGGHVAELVDQCLHDTVSIVFPAETQLSPTFRRKRSWRRP